MSEITALGLYLTESGKAQSAHFKGSFLVDSVELHSSLPNSVLHLRLLDNIHASTHFFQLLEMRRRSSSQGVVLSGEQLDMTRKSGLSSN